MKRLCLWVMISILLIASTGCAKEKTNPIPSYTAYSNLNESYSLEDAKKDGCVVFEDLHLTSGEEHWLNFLAETKKGKTATIRLAQYYTLEAQKEHVSPELYEEIKEEYPRLFLVDLSYDGTKYTTFYVEEDTEFRREYLYLNHYTGEARKGAAYSRYDCYILVNDKLITYEDLEKAMVSSHSDAWIDQNRIYINLIQ